MKYDEALTVQTTLHRLPQRLHPEIKRAGEWKADAVRAWRQDDEITQRPRQRGFVEESNSVPAVVRLLALKIVATNGRGIASDLLSAWTQLTQGLREATGHL